MAAGIGTIQVKREHGVLVVQGLGKTPRGQKFIRRTTPLKSKNITSKGFKSEMRTAVEEMLAQSVLPI